MKTLTAILCVAALSAHGVETVSIPTLPAPSLIDGELSDASWPKAFKTGAFVAADPGGKLTEQAEGYLFCDDENLYVGAKMHFDDYAAHEKWLSWVPGGKTRYGGDSIEVFVDPGDTGNYAQIGVPEADGTLFSIGFCAPVKVAVQLHNSDWTMEAKIPFSAIKLMSGSFGKTWRVNFARYNREKQELSSWATLGGGGFHNLAAFNRVKGINADLVAIRKEQEFSSRGEFELSSDHLVYTTQTVARATLDFLYDKPMKGFKAVATIKDEAGNTVAEKSVSPIALHVDFDFAVGGLADGRYDVEVAILDAEGNSVKSGETAFWKIPPMKPNPVKWEIRNHCIYRNGAFVFPIVTTLCGWNGGASRAEYQEKAEAVFSELADCGFTAVTSQPHDYPEEDEETIRRCKAMYPWDWKHYKPYKAAGVTFADYCAIAEKHGIGVIARCPYLIQSTTSFAKGCFVDHVRRLRDIPNVVGWHVSDEEDGRPEYNSMINRLYHEVDPSRLSWINVITAVAQNVDTADVVSTDPYPIPTSRPSVVASHGDRLLRATEGRPWRARWLYLQMFGGHRNWTRPPTPDEIRCMTMLALNHGSTGLAYFMWQPHAKRDGKCQHPESMATIKELSAVLRKYAPALCQGSVVFRGRVGGADVLAVEHEGRRVLSVVNDTDGDISDMKIEIPDFGKASVSLKKYEYAVIEL